MPKRALSTLGVLVREKRGGRRLRDVAGEIGISAATLMRIEAGRVPDVETFGKVCLWLGIQTDEFLGTPSHPETKAGVTSGEDPRMRISAHFKADRLPLPATATALANMLLLVARKQVASTMDPGDVDA